MIKKFIKLVALVLVALLAQPVYSMAVTSYTLPAELENLPNFVLPQGKSWEDKHFREGLLNGRRSGDFYYIENKENKKVNPEKLIEYCEQHNFIYGSHSLKQVKMFGTGGVDVLNTLYFLPKDLYIKYVFEKASQKGDDFGALTKKGSLVYISPFSNSDLIELNDVMWSGNVIDGKIDGIGVGICKYKSDYHCYFSGTFNKGIPQGKVTGKLVKGNSNSVFVSPNDFEVGDWSEGVAPFKATGNSNYGLLSRDGNNLSISLSPKFPEFLSTYHDGKITVMRGEEEIYVNKKGEYIDLTPRQKQQNQLKEKQKKMQELEAKKEAERKELAERQARLEKERQAREAEKHRVEMIRNARPGDRIYYNQKWKKSSFFGWFEENYTMRIICFVEENVDNGERLKIRVGSVESSDDNNYSTPEIDGIKYRKGDVIWIKPLENSGWRM